jgi:hypothetical protein
VIGAALEDGVRRSATIRRLGDVIDASDLIVYLSRGNCPRPAVACLMMGPREPETRYVRINFRLPDGPGVPRAWHRDDLTAMIAHELQHAAEVAGWPDVVDGATLRAAHKRAGHLAGMRLDTDAAIKSGDVTRLELNGRR